LVESPVREGREGQTVIAGHELALAQLTVLGASALETVDAAADAGFDAVTLRIVDGTDAPNPLLDDPALRTRAARRIREHGISLLDVEVVRLRPERGPVPAPGVLEAAAELGARHLLVVGQDPDLARTSDQFSALTVDAAAHGMRTVLEFMVYNAVRTLADAWAIVEAADAAAGILVDPLHLARSGGSPAEVAALVARHPERFPYAQLCDAPLTGPGPERRALFDEAIHDRRLPGEGELPLADLVDALPAGAPLSLEVPTPAFAGMGPHERARRTMAAARAALSSA
jgi:sugar phosphate isomerase/epimerase